jgi:hypothetical protein
VEHPLTLVLVDHCPSQARFTFALEAQSVFQACQQPALMAA